MLWKNGPHAAAVSPRALRDIMPGPQSRPDPLSAIWRALLDPAPADDVHDREYRIDIPPPELSGGLFLSGRRNGYFCRIGQ